MFEPQPTPFDLRWRMLGTDIRVHPLFWVFTAILGWDFSKLGLNFLLLWILCVFVSVLLHEFGHVLMGRLFGSEASIVLYSFGGLAIGATGRTRWQRILVLFAGPGIQLLLWSAILAIDLILRSQPGFRVPIHVEVALFMLYQINLYWALLNLLPIFPLDGGQISREIFEMVWKARGLVYSLLLSGILAAVLAVNALMAANGRPLIPSLDFGGFYLAILFAMLAVSSFQLWAAENQRVNRSSRYDDRLPWE